MTDDLVKRLRAFEGSDELGNGDFAVCDKAADTIIQLRADLDKLRGAVAVTPENVDRIFKRMRKQSMWITDDVTRAILEAIGAEHEG